MFAESPKHRDLFQPCDSVAVTDVDRVEGGCGEEAPALVGVRGSGVQDPLTASQTDGGAFGLEVDGHGAAALWRGWVQDQEFPRVLYEVRIEAAEVALPDDSVDLAGERADVVEGGAKEHLDAVLLNSGDGEGVGAGGGDQVDAATRPGEFDAGRGRDAGFRRDLVGDEAGLGAGVDEEAEGSGAVDPDVVDNQVRTEPVERSLSGEKQCAEQQSCHAGRVGSKLDLGRDGRLIFAYRTL